MSLEGKYPHYNKILFADESGNEGVTSLGKPGVSKYYLVGAIVVDAENAKNIETAFGEVARTEFQGEMKSKKAKKLNRRIRVLDKLFSIDGFSVDVLVVDKTKLTSKGYQYPKSFIKNIQHKMYDSFKGHMCDILIITDQIKTPNFNEDFEKYIYQNLESTLWSRKEMVTIDSTKSFGVQAVDFIVGSILKGYEKPSEYDEISKHIPKNRVTFSHFPDSLPEYLFDIGLPATDEYNREIAEEALAIALDYIHKNNSSDDESINIRTTCLERLVSEYIFGDKKKWVSAIDLLSYVNSQLVLNKTKESLRYHIGKMKEKGVLIASKTEGGYKIPCCVKDMELFINNMGAKIVPMIDRMKKARDIIIRTSASDFDIIEDKPIYKNLIAAYEKVKDMGLVVAEDE